MMPEPKSHLWFPYGTDPETIEREIRANAESAELVRFDSDAFFTPERLRDLKLPRLRDLAIGSLCPLKEPHVQAWFEGLAALRRLDVRGGDGQREIFSAMAASPWWPKLASFSARFRSLDGGEAWGSLWQTCPLELNLVCLMYLDTAQAAAIVSGQLPKLRRLALGCGLTDDIFPLLAGAELPELRLLELQHNGLGGAAFRRFVQGPRPGLPKLKQVGWKYYSDRIEEYHDWNGAVVGSGNEAMTDAELHKAFFKGSTLKLAPYDPKLAQRFDTQQADAAFGYFLSAPGRSRG